MGIKPEIKRDKRPHSPHEVGAEEVKAKRGRRPRPREVAGGKGGKQDHPPKKAKGLLGRVRGEPP